MIDNYIPVWWWRDPLTQNVILITVLLHSSHTSDPIQLFFNFSVSNSSGVEEYFFESRQLGRPGLDVFVYVHWKKCIIFKYYFRLYTRLKILSLYNNNSYNRNSRIRWPSICVFACLLLIPLCIFFFKYTEV